MSPSSSLGGIDMGKKSRRFIQRSVNVVNEHDKRFPYRTTYAEAEARKMRNENNSPLGGL